jgi:hypothetical protein
MVKYKTFGTVLYSYMHTWEGDRDGRHLVTDPEGSSAVPPSISLHNLYWFRYDFTLWDIWLASIIEELQRSWSR